MVYKSQVWTFEASYNSKVRIFTYGYYVPQGEGKLLSPERIFKKNKYKGSTEVMKKILSVFQQGVYESQRKFHVFLHNRCTLYFSLKTLSFWNFIVTSSSIHFAPYNFVPSKFPAAMRI